MHSSTWTWSGSECSGVQSFFKSEVGVKYSFQSYIKVMFLHYDIWICTFWFKLTGIRLSALPLPMHWNPGLSMWFVEHLKQSGGWIHASPHEWCFTTQFRKLTKHKILLQIYAFCRAIVSEAWPKKYAESLAIVGFTNAIGSSALKIPGHDRSADQTLKCSIPMGKLDDDRMSMHW